MPYKNYNADMNEYMKSRYVKRREEALEYLGGRCASCGSIDNLEFDHIDPEQKSINIGKMLAGYSWDKIHVELDKCQILCDTCHDAKTYGRVV